MDSGKSSNPGDDKGKGKAFREGKRKKLGKDEGKAVGKKKKRAPRWKGVDGQKWVPGDPLPDSPTRSQLIAHNNAMVDVYLSKLDPPRDPARDLSEDPDYQEVLQNFRFVPPEDGLPDGAETMTVLADDPEHPFIPSPDSSECSSGESDCKDGGSDFDT